MSRGVQALPSSPFVVATDDECYTRSQADEFVTARQKTAGSPPPSVSVTRARYAQDIALIAVEAASP